MKLGIFLVCLLSVILVSVEAGYKHKKSRKWKKYTEQHSLNFKSDDHQENAFENFDKIDQLIEENNKKNTGFKMQHNQLSHLSEENRKAKLGFVTAPRNRSDYFFNPDKNGINFEYYAPKYIQLPESYDWEQNGWKVPVKNQGECGSCWVFSAVSAIEFQVWKKNKNIVKLSTQEPVDCASEYNFYKPGCKGGWSAFVYAYSIHNGLNYEQNYPYMSGFTNAEGSCDKNTGKPKQTVKSYVLAERGNDRALMEMLVNYGAVSVILDLGSFTHFQFFGSGIFSPSWNKVCSPNGNQLHAVLLVGYGVKDGQKFWKIKNQWGPQYGDNGYWYISRDVTNNCGISSFEASVPLI